MRNSIYETDAQYAAFIMLRNRRPVITTAEQLDALKNSVLSFPGGKILFDTPVIIKKTPQQELFHCYGAWADRQRGLWLLDGQGEWHEIRHNQANAAQVIAGIDQRIKVLHHERA